VDRSNAALVDAFNNKIQAYNALVAKAKAEQTSLNARVLAYNARLSTYGLSSSLMCSSGD